MILNNALHQMAEAIFCRRSNSNLSFLISRSAKTQGIQATHLGPFDLLANSRHRVLLER